LVDPLADLEAERQKRRAARGAAERACTDADAAGSVTPESDLRNAERIASRHRQELRHVRAIGWMRWDGRRWAPSPTYARECAARVGRYVHEEASALHKRASETEIEEERQRLGERAGKLARWAKASEAEPRIGAALRLAEVPLNLAAEQLDCRTWLLNVANGVLDLKTGGLRPHDPADYLTQLAPVEYDTTARAPRWERFINDVTCGRSRLALYLQRVAGYCLTGDTSEQCAFFANGGGLNGKTTFIQALLGVLGDYGKRAHPELLLATRGDRHPADVADLRGARLVATSELADQRTWDTQRLKDLAGEPTAKARFMRQDFFTFPVTFKLLIAGNHRPPVNDHSRGFWRRMKLIPFDATFTHPDKRLPEKLAAERPGILRWAIEGCLLWQREGGLQEPPEIVAAVESYRRETDLLAAFLEEATDSKEGSQAAAPAGELHAAYRAFCVSRGGTALHGDAFMGAMAERGFKRKRTNRGIFYLGVCLLPAEGRV
jgi:putative DNA primase/helicase